VLVAWAMKRRGRSAPEHGFPRACRAGLLRTNNVKWLSRLTLTAERPDSLYTTRLYNRRVDGEMRPVRELDVHAVIVSPAEGAVLEAGRHAIAGWAWSAWPVSAVDVSTDGGKDVAACARDPTRRWSSVAGVHLRVGRRGARSVRSARARD